MIGITSSDVYVLLFILFHAPKYQWFQFKVTGIVTTVTVIIFQKFYHILSTFK